MYNRSKNIKLFFLLLFFTEITTTLLAQEVNFSDSNLPVIVINTHGQIIPHDDPKIVVDMGIIYNGEGVRNSINDPFNEYNGKIAIRLRGQSSGLYPKHSWGFETQDEDGENLNVALLGLPSENDWVLHAPYADKTFMRNALTFKLSNDIGLWAPRTKFCELILNGDYHGIYVLMEKIKQDPNRVNITAPDEDDMTGGYLLEITDWGKIDPDEIYFVTPQSDKPIVVKFPKPDDLTPDQLHYISDYFSLFDQATYGNDFTDPQIGFPNYLDVESTVKSIIINELVKNIDAFHASSFMYKPKQSKLFMGPLWDFNVALGNFASSLYFSTSGWISNSPKHKWVNKLITDEHFESLLNQRWRDLINSELETEVIMETIDEWMEILYEAQERNFIRWPVLGVFVNPNYFVGETFEDEINYLKNWVSDRLEWIENETSIDFSYDVSVTEIYRGNNYGPYSCDWIEIYNPYTYSINLQDYKLVTNNPENYFVIDHFEIAPESYVIAGNADADFNGICDFNLFQNIDVLTGTETLSLFNPSGELVDFVEMNFDTRPYFAIDPYMPSGVISPFLENAEGSNWKLSPNIGGSPGTRNYQSEITLVINEILAKNVNTNFDEFWEYDDWVEIYNYGEYPIDLTGLYFTDDPDNLLKFQMSKINPEEILIFPEEYKVLWADENLQQGSLHLGLKLNAAGEYFAICRDNGKEIVIIDSLSYGQQIEGVSFGRKPIASNNWTFYHQPTPGDMNQIIVDVEDEFSSTSEYELRQNYPNPFNNQTAITYSLPYKSFVSLEIYDILGRKIISLTNSEQTPGTYQLVWNGKNSSGISVSSGLYFTVFNAVNNVETEPYLQTSKIVLIK